MPTQPTYPDVAAATPPASDPAPAGQSPSPSATLILRELRKRRKNLTDADFDRLERALAAGEAAPVLSEPTDGKALRTRCAAVAAEYGRPIKVTSAGTFDNGRVYAADEIARKILALEV